MNRNRNRSYGGLRGLSRVGGVADVEDADMGAFFYDWSPTDGVYADSPALTSTAPGDSLNRFGQGFMDLAQKALALKQLKEVNDVNLARAQRGLPLLDARALAPQVNVGVNPQTEQTLKYIAWGALGLGAVYIFTQMGRR